MEQYPSEIIEHDGDVISRADYDSLENNVNDTLTVNADTEDDQAFNLVAARAAGRVVEEVAKVEVIRSTVATAYDTASALVETRMDQGLDGTAAWQEADPTGMIRQNFEAEENQQQSERISVQVNEIRQATHDAKVAAIEQIASPSERERAMRELLAVEKADESRRGRRF